MRSFFSIIVIVFTGMCAQGVELSTELGIVPRPLNVTSKSSPVFHFTTATKVYAGNDVANSSEYLIDRITRSTGENITVVDTKPTGDYIELLINKNLVGKSDQAYRLDVSENSITIEGKSPVAVFYGVQTLLQLLPVTAFGDNGDANLDWQVPSVTVNDEPYFKQFRGLHIDVSREFMTKEEILRVIDYLAIHKMNVLHIHLTDNEGWRMQIDAYPKLTSVGAMPIPEPVNSKKKKKRIKKQHSHNKKGPNFYTKDQLREIIAYANKRYITVFPEIDMPGHMVAALHAYPELQPPNYKPGNVIRIDDKGIEFCKNILKEVHEVFGDVPIHFGFDEVNLKREPEDFFPEDELLHFANAIADYIKNELKTTPILWNEAFEMGMSGDDILIHVWRLRQYKPKGKELAVDEQVQRGNQPYILSPNDRVYINFKQDKRGVGRRNGLTPADLIYNWDPMMDLHGADPTKRHLARGIIACVWGETVDGFNSWQQHVFPRLAVVSEKCWTQPADMDTTKPNWITWRDSVLIKKQLERYKQMGIHYWSMDKPQLLLDLKGITE